MREDRPAAVVACGRIAEAKAETCCFGEHAGYVLTEEEGHGTIYPLCGAFVNLSPYKATVIGVRGEVAETEPVG